MEEADTFGGGLGPSKAIKAFFVKFNEGKIYTSNYLRGRFFLYFLKWYMVTPCRCRCIVSRKNKKYGATEMEIVKHEMQEISELNNCVRANVQKKPVLTTKGNC